MSPIRSAGITLSGGGVKTSDGPFAGTLTLSGSGLDGTVRPAAAGQYHRADLSARANGAQIPSEPPPLVQRGIIEATPILLIGRAHVCTPGTNAPLVCPLLL